MAILRTGRATTIAGTAAAMVCLLTACGGASGTAATAPQTLPGTARPAAGDSPSPSTTPAPAGATGTGTDAVTGTLTTSADSSATGASAASAGKRCHTSELHASVGANDPGAGQENFPIVLTNASKRTCTLYGYPGAAFVDSAGKQLGPDPKRSSATPTTVTLAPGASAWAGLTFSNPGISGAKTATPAALLITPPDELSQLKVAWTQGAVPVSGNASSVFLTVFRAGTGA
jgi:hypothetical protein